MARPKTVERVAAITATLHDGKNMIVLSEGKTVTVAESSIPYLENRRALVTDKPQLDHDGDGEAGGSESGGSGDEMKALRAEYEQVVGKKPFPGWDEATLREKMAEAEADDGAPAA